MEYIEIFFGAILSLLYKIIENYGVSIVLFTLLVKLAIFPLDLKQRKSTARMQKIQPILNQIQKKYANDKDKLNKEIAKVYSEYKISPMSGCLPMLIQFPIIFALYWVIRQPITYMMGIRDVADQALIIVNFNDWAVLNKDALVGGLKEFYENGQKITGNNYSMYEIQIAQLIHHNKELFNFIGETAKANGLGAISSLDISTVDFTFLGLNLAETPSFGKIGSLIMGNVSDLTWHDAALWLIPLGSGLSSWVSTKITQAQTQGKQDKNRVIPESEKVKDDKASSMKTMTMMMPIISAWFTFSFPAALGLYWIISNLIQLAQTFLVNKFVMPKLENDSFKGDYIDVKENRKKRKKH
ncbi:MAG: YidC/Oxa1 family membrane protein insertase [Clostridia bacterium]|nr:YidC/Oxa1 family membrane protein insertase [Clostridia bacterium]